MRELVAYSAIAATVDPTVTYDEWVEILGAVTLSARGANWWLGDMLVYGEEQWGTEKADAAMEPKVALALGEGTIRSCVWVSRAITPNRRRPDLSWSHHRVIAHFPPDQQMGWLGKTAREGWTCQELREAVRVDASGGQGGETREEQAEGGLSGVYDHPRFGEAARLRFGMTLGADVEAFTRQWIDRHARAAVREIDW